MNVDNSWHNAVNVDKCIRYGTGRPVISYLLRLANSLRDNRMRQAVCEWCAGHGPCTRAGGHWLEYWGVGHRCTRAGGPTP